MDRVKNRLFGWLGWLDSVLYRKSLSVSVEMLVSTGVEDLSVWGGRSV